MRWMWRRLISRLTKCDRQLLVWYRHRSVLQSRDAMARRGVCPSVRLSETLVYCMKTAKLVLIIFTVWLDHSNCSIRNYYGEIPMRSSTVTSNAGWYEKSWFSTNISLYLGNDIRYGHGTPMCDLSSGAIFSDLECMYVSLTQIIIFHWHAIFQADTDGHVTMYWLSLHGLSLAS